MNRKCNWLISIAVNVVIVVLVFILTNPVYETNDDFAISSRIVDGYAEVYFVNYYLCKVLIALQEMFSSINVYVLAQMIGAFASFVCIYKVILDANKDIFVRIISALTISVFAFDHYCTIQFTKTSAIMLVAGTMLAVDAITREMGLPQFIASMILLYIGVAFRIDGLVAALAFAGLYLLDWVIQSRSSLKELGVFTSRKLAVYALLIVLIAGCYGFQDLSNRANTDTKALKEYDEYNWLRSAVVDYPMFEYYENSVDEYAAIGMSENDLYLIDHWFFDYNGAASKENLQKIIEVDKADPREPYTVEEAVKAFAKSTMKSVKKLGFIGVHIIVLLVLALWVAFRLKPRHWLYVIAIGTAALLMHIALYYVQRPGYRAIYIADVATAIWLIYYTSINSSATDGKNSKALRTVVDVCVVICLCVSIMPIRQDCTSAQKGAEARVMSSEMSEYLKKHNDCFFTFSTGEKRPNVSYAHPLTPPDTYSERNAMGSGSWGTMSPYLLEKLGQYNLSNPISDIIDNEKAYYVGNSNIKRIVEYYNKWYGTEGRLIEMEEADEIDGVKIWKVKIRTSGKP